MKKLTKQEKAIIKGCKFGTIAGVLMLFTIIGIPLGFILILVCGLIKNNIEREK